MLTKSVVFAGFAAIAAAKPMAYPQMLDLDAILAQGPPASASIATTAGVITVDPTSLASAAASAVTASPLPQTLLTTAVDNKKRQATACAPQPTGAGPVPSPDTASAFLADASISSIASAAPTPSGFQQSFVNLHAENNAYGYMGYTLLSSYDTASCAAQCTNILGCQAINIAFERAPSVDPGTGCEDPASTTLIKCVFWGSPIDAANAVNTGETRGDFTVVVAGSNGYNLINTEQPASGYIADANLGNASINAPLDCNGNGSYMGYVSWNDGQPFSVERCAAACTAQSNYNVQHPPATGEPLTCQYFNTYFLMKNGLVQAQVCSMYTQTWGEEYAVNTGYYYQSDVYTIASSVIYSNATDSGTCVKV